MRRGWGNGLFLKKGRKKKATLERAVLGELCQADISRYCRNLKKLALFHLPAPQGKGYPAFSSIDRTHLLPAFSAGGAF